MNYIKLFAAIMILCGSFAHGKAEQFDFKSRLGVVDVNEGGKLCLMISNPSLNKADLLNLIVLSRRQSLVRARIAERLGQSCSHNLETVDTSFYLLQLIDRNKTFTSEQKQAAAIAVVSSASVEIRRGKASLDLDKDGRREFFRDCTSNEGVHLTVWTGKPLVGMRRWHFYYYLGYDVVPSCRRKDFL